MSTRALRPWTDLVKLHPDVEAGALTEAVFAIDLGAIAANDPNVPVVNRDPEAFFRATYLTADLRRLLEEVLKYMERAAAVSALDSTLQRQAKDFFQNLTVEVAGSKNAALVYSLT